MSKQNSDTPSDDDLALVERVRNVQTALKNEKIEALLKDTANPKLALAQREMLANRAMWTLKDAQKGQDNQIDYNLPQPHFIEFRSLQPVSLPDYALTKDAYSSNDTSTLFLRLELIQQVAEANMFGPPLGADSNPAQMDEPTKTVMATIDGLKNDLRESHYAKIAVGLHLHYYLDSLFDRWGGNKFLDAKTQLEGLLMAYNAHAPAYAVSIEENASRSFRVVTGITNDVLSFLASPAFYQLQQAKQVQENTPAAPVAAAPPPAVAAAASAPPFLFPSVVATPAPVVPPAAPASAAPSATAAVSVAKVSRVKKKKGSGFASVFAVTAAESVTIDLSPTRNPTDVISEIGQLFLTYIGEGLDTINQMKVAAQGINYNIYTNQFGSTASLTDNVSMLENIRGNILRYIANQFHPSPSLQPLIFIVQNMTTKFFPGPLGPGDPVSSLNLLPGESVEKRMKTSETDSTKRAQANSVVDSTSQNAKQSLQNTLQNKQTSEHDAVNNFSDHVNTNQTMEQHDNTTKSGIGIAGTGAGNPSGTGAGGQAQGPASGVGSVMQTVGGIMSMIPGVGGILGGVVNAVGGMLGGGGAAPGVGQAINTAQNMGLTAKAGPTMDITSDKDVTSGRDEDTNQVNNDTRKDGTEAMQQAVSNNSQETNASREVSVTDSTETTSETTKEDSETRTFKNPNRSSTMTIIFSKIIRRYEGVTLWSGEQVMFSNGIVSDTVPVNEMDSILNRIIRADHPEVKKMVHKLLKQSLKVADYQGRVVDCLDMSAGFPHVKIQPYFDVIESAGLTEQPGDAAIRPFNDDLLGVVTGVRSYTMVVPGVFADVEVGHTGLDANEQALFQADYDRRLIDNDQARADLKGSQIANDRAKLDNDAFKGKVDFVEGIKDDETRITAYFELLKDDRTIFDKTELMRFLGKDRKGFLRLPQTEI